jgi:hypothetical protein
MTATRDWYDAAMQPEAFVAWRQRELEGAPLVGHRLRQLLPQRWVRFHSLPGSKRYPDTDEQLDEIRRRHDLIAGALLGEGEPIVIVRRAYSRTASPVPPEDCDGQWSSEGFVWFESMSSSEIEGESSDEPPSYTHFWLSHSTFRPGAFAVPWALVANDVIRVLLVNVERRCVFAPYDGGVDVIAADSFVRDALRRDFDSWLSTHPLGL